MKSSCLRWPTRSVVSGLALISLAGLTGCQVDVGGQTLPSPYYQYDDVQYFPPGPEFKLSREAAAMEAFKNQGLPSENLPPGAQPAAIPVAPAAPPAAAPAGPVPVPVAPIQ